MRIRSSRRFGAALACLVVPAVYAQEATTPAPAADVVIEPYLRSADDGGLIRLETAARRFKRVDGTGPRLDLVGVTHVGDASYYTTLQRRLKASEVVLYESVKPAGTGGAGGDTPAERRASTDAALRFVAGLAERARLDTKAYPRSLDELRGFAMAADPRAGVFFDVARVDAWGTSFVYETSPNGNMFVLSSLGADGAPGGEDEAADLVVPSGSVPAPPSKDEAGFQLQAELARLLGLKFQLDFMDYSAANWWCSDLAMDELQAAMIARGADGSFLGGLEGFGLPPEMMTGFVDMLKMADGASSGAISDTFKAMIVEMLGDPQALPASMEQLGPGVMEAIIVDRNLKVLEDLQMLRQMDDSVQSVAIFYGAGHMDDFEERLRAMGWVPTETTWHDAISVDLRNRPMVRESVKMMKQMMKEMGGGGGLFGN